MTGGIGARTAHSTPCISTKRPSQNLSLTIASSVKQRKKIEIVNAQSKEILRWFNKKGDVIQLVYCTNCGKETLENSEYCPNCKASVRCADSLNGTAAEKILSESALQQHWVKRVIAITIDSIIVGIATALLGFATDVSGVFNWMSLPFVMGLIYVLYFTASESTYGYTMGKRLVNLKVAKSNGERPGLVNAFVRNISKIHFLVLLFDTLAGFFISRDSHQRYIDQFANTTVV